MKIATPFQMDQNTLERNFVMLPLHLRIIKKQKAYDLMLLNL
jgi:hypothetical protein